MADQRRTGAGAATDGDPVQELLHGVTDLLDELAALSAGSGTAGGALQPDQLAPLIGRLGAVVGELGEVLAGVVTALIAVLETVAELLRGEHRAAGAAATGFEQIPVRITMPGTGR